VIIIKNRGHKNMAVTIATVKPLNKKQAEKFYASLKTSKITKEAVKKANKIRIKGFNCK
jgi:hypothetical protein